MVSSRWCLSTRSWACKASGFSRYCDACCGLALTLLTHACSSVVAVAVVEAWAAKGQTACASHSLRPIT